MTLQLAGRPRGAARRDGDDGGGGVTIIIEPGAVPRRKGALTLETLGYLFEPTEEYYPAIRSAKTRAALLRALKQYKLIANDAIPEAEMTEAEFVWFKKGVSDKRRQGVKYARRFGAILLPIIILEVWLVAKRFHAPWGTAFRRMHQEGLLTVKNGIAELTP